MTVITELEEDALKEFFNMGLGMAADSLSQMVDKEVFLSLPQLAIVSRSEALDLVEEDSGERMAAIRQKFQGELYGTALLIFPGAKSLALVRALLEDDTPLETLSELEQETLLDVGNVILNAFLTSFTQMMSLEFDFEQAEFLRAALDSLLDFDAHLNRPEEAPTGLEREAFFLVMNFSTGEETERMGALRGYVMLLFSPEGMAVLRRELQRIIAEF